ncbi:MAG: VOC family protein [Planctomycetota bacterium]
MPISGLTELVLVVRDVRAATHFYEHIVGLTLERPADDEWAWFWSGEPGASARLALSRGPLLFEEHSPHPAGARFGCAHFAFNVAREDIDARLATVRANDIEIFGPTSFDWMNADSWYFYDPDGNLVEFWVPRHEEGRRQMA